MSACSHRRRWLFVWVLLAHGLLFQTTTGCAELAAGALSGLSTSIANEFIRNTVNHFMGLASSDFSFSGLGT